MSFTVSDYLLTRLAELGVDHVFTVPGDYAGDFMLDMDDDPRVTRVATQTELGAGYAADGYGRTRGIGAACVQYGVGSMSLLNCVAGSFVERVPVVIISASPSRASQRMERDQGVLFHHSTGDLPVNRDIFSTVTVASEIISKGEHAPKRIDRALAAMVAWRRPIYIEVLQDIWRADCQPPEGPLPTLKVRRRRKATGRLVKAIKAKIEASERPVLWLGAELQRYGLQDLIQRLVDASGLPFTTTSLGKTVLDEAQAAFAGTYAGPASPAATQALVAQSDCFIGLGTLVTDDYLDLIGGQYGDMIVVTDTEARVGERWFQPVAVAGVLEALVAWFGERGPLEPAFAPAPDTPAPTGCSGETDLCYVSFYETLSATLAAGGLGQDATLVLGESTQLYVFGNMAGLGRDSFVAQAAWGSLGHETAAALGIAVGTGRRPIVVAGDGGFRMVCQELLSMSALGLDPVVFVMSNDTYTIEQAFVDLGSFEPGGEFAGFDLLPSIDYLALAKAFGARGYRVSTLAELQAVMTELGPRGTQPSLVQVVLDKQDIPPQLVALATPPPAVEEAHPGHGVADDRDPEI